MEEINLEINNGNNELLIKYQNQNNIKTEDKLKKENIEAKDIELCKNSTAPDPNLDKGWAWIVLIMMFLDFFIASGMFYSSSIFFVQFLQVFGSSHLKTSWIFSLNSSVHQFCGPISSMLIARWGPRTAVVLGGLFASLGYFLSSISTSLNYLFITHGFINAIGTSLNFSGSIVGLSKFWKKNYSMALAFAMSGSGCGVFFMGPLIVYIVDEYGWRIAMITCAALCLQFSLFGFTLYKKKRTNSSTECQSRSFEKNQNCKVVNELSKIEKTYSFCKSKFELNDSCLSESGYMYKEKPRDSSLVSQKKSFENDENCKVVNDCSKIENIYNFSNTNLEPNATILSVSESMYTNSDSILKIYFHKLKNIIRNIYKHITKKKQIDKEEYMKQKETITNLKWSLSFRLLQISCFLSILTTTTLFSILQDWVNTINMIDYFSYTLSAIGAGDLIGRLAAGIIPKRYSALLVLSNIQLFLAISIGVASYSTNCYHLIISFLFMGIFFGFYSVVFALVPTKLASGVGLNWILGQLLLSQGFGALAGPPLAGVIVDYMKSYNIVMILCTCSAIGAALLNVISYGYSNYLTKK